MDLVGKTDRFTLEEARELYEKLRTEYLYYTYALVNEVTDDEEERANINVNLAHRLGALLGACELIGVLEGPDAYLENLPLSDGVKIE